MPNMSYCRFRNTKKDLEECIDALNNNENLSESEAGAAISMLIDITNFLNDNYLIDRTNNDYKKEIRHYISSFINNDDEEEE